MPRTTIRYRREGDGWRYEIRDARRRLVASAVVAGDKSEARDEARAARDDARRSKRVA